MVELERSHPLGLLTERSHFIDGIVQLLRQLLYQHDAILSSQVEEEEEDEDGDTGEDEERRWEVLLTLNRTVDELLRLRGVALLPALEEHLLPFAAKWLEEAGGEEDEDPHPLTASLTFLAHLITASSGQAAAAAYAADILPVVLRSLHAVDVSDSAGSELAEAVVYALGVVAQHGGTVLAEEPAAPAAFAKVAALLQKEDACVPRRLVLTEKVARHPTHPPHPHRTRTEPRRHQPPCCALLCRRR